MGKIISPSQVARFDGNKVFVELMADALTINKILLNFCQYDKTNSKGNRMQESIGIYLDIGTAAVFSANVLSGQIALDAAESRSEAEKKGSKYPAPVWSYMGGTNSIDAGRSDGKAESRQCKLIPGSMKPWILTAEKGAGHISGTGLIVPDYTSGKGDAIIRVPLTDESLKELALLLSDLHYLWTIQKFGEINDFDASSLKGYTMQGMKKSPIIGVFKQCSHKLEEGKITLSQNLRMNVEVGSLPINKILFGFIENSNNLLSVFMDITKAQVLAQDILSGRLEKIKRKRVKEGKTEPIFHMLGGTVKEDEIVSRQLKLLWGTTPETENRWIIQGTAGAGHVSGTGLIVPDYTDETAETRCSLCLTTQELKRLAICIQNVGILWTIKKFGPIVHQDFISKRKETERRIANLRKN